MFQTLPSFFNYVFFIIRCVGLIVFLIINFQWWQMRAITIFSRWSIIERSLTVQSIIFGYSTKMRIRSMKERIWMFIVKILAWRDFESRSERWWWNYITMDWSCFWDWYLKWGLNNWRVYWRSWGNVRNSRWLEMWNVSGCRSRYLQFRKSFL